MITVAIVVAEALFSSLEGFRASGNNKLKQKVLITAMTSKYNIQLFNQSRSSRTSGN